MQIVFSRSSAALVGTGLLKSHSTRHTTVGRAPLDERSVHRRDLYLTTHSTHKTQTSIPLAAFELATPVSDQPQTPALDRSATGMDSEYHPITGHEGLEEE
jgi:hypothetical protein